MKHAVKYHLLTSCCLLHCQLLQSIALFLFRLIKWLLSIFSKSWKLSLLESIHALIDSSGILGSRVYVIFTGVKLGASDHVLFLNFLGLWVAYNSWVEFLLLLEKFVLEGVILGSVFLDWENTIFAVLFCNVFYNYVYKMLNINIFIG